MNPSMSVIVGDFRSWLTRANSPMKMAFIQIEDEIQAMRRRILELEEENQRLSRLLCR